MKAYLMSSDDVLHQLHSSKEGLPEDAAQKILQRDGTNELPSPSAPGFFSRLWQQIADPMVLILLAAAFVSAALNEWADSIIIMVVVLLNSLLGLYQEGRAQKAAAALASLSAPEALVRRDGYLRRLPAAQLVRGDIVLVEAGDLIPADMRLLEALELSTDEALLSGESLPQNKDASFCPDQSTDIPLAEQRNMLFMGTAVVRGHGTAVVTDTGADTCMGHIAGLLDKHSTPPTPLQKRLFELSRILSTAVLFICAVVFALSMLNAHSSWLDAFLLAVSLAVAAIPEGLVVVVTLVLSLGMNNMSRKKAIIRRLAAVETLGAVSVICSDKTGTLTANRMQVTEAWGCREQLCRTAALCSSVRYDEQSGWLGEPTETALAEFAAQKGFHREQLLKEYPLLTELPFDSSRKMMSTLHRHSPTSQHSCQYTKGAFEQVLAHATHWMDEQGQVHLLNDNARQEISKRAEEMAQRALRVLAAACREKTEFIGEEQLTVCGLFGLMDPPRPEVGKAIKQASTAGVLTVMVSGDNITTATAIATELGILSEGQEAVSGSELEQMSDAELMERLDKIRVFARVKPEDKLRIVQAWQKKGVAVAMTGDGVNDAPALQAADIGVGMGLCGAEVSKRAASLVLADDNFATIVSAVEEGRRIYDNIRRAVQFLLSSNLAEVLAIFAASLLGLKLFLPVHLLWINLITDCIPAIALGMEAAAPNSMRRPPRKLSDSIFAQGVGVQTLWQGTAIAVLTLASYMYGLSYSTAVATTMAFITLSATELFHAWNMRSRDDSIFSLPTANPYLAAGIVGAFILNLALIYCPATAGLFQLTALSARQLLVSSLLSFTIVPVVEISKALRKCRTKNTPLMP